MAAGIGFAAETLSRHSGLDPESSVPRSWAGAGFNRPGEELHERLWIPAVAGMAVGAAVTGVVGARPLNNLRALRVGGVPRAWRMGEGQIRRLQRLRRVGGMRAWRWGRTAGVAVGEDRGRGGD